MGKNIACGVESPGLRIGRKAIHPSGRKTSASERLLHAMLVGD
jgi:hypothetical protein